MERQQIKLDAAEGKAFAAYWVVENKYAHPHWDSYLVCLFDLTTDMGTPPELFAEGMTHQIEVWALNPKEQNKLNLEDMVIDKSLLKFVLTPQNHVYQFKAENNDEAFDRVNGIANDIENLNLNPDTDARGIWNNMFLDGAKSPRRR